MDQLSELMGKKKPKNSSISTSAISLSQDFHGFELLLIRRLQTDPVVCSEWRTKLLRFMNIESPCCAVYPGVDEEEEDISLGEIPHNLWYLAVTLDRKRERFLSFIRNEVLRVEQQKILVYRDSFLGRYLNSHLFTELHLDGIFKYGDDNTLPEELFKCPSVRWLSLKYNYLDRIPPDIGRMVNLEHLSLTNNKLQNKSVPYTLTFCRRLHTLMLDNNLLDALPGFLLKMASLDTVHRHGNHNYFKSTFMWYHTDVNERILETTGGVGVSPRQPESLKFWASKAVIGLKIDFFSDVCVTPVLKDYISRIYTRFNVCGMCNRTKLCNGKGYKVITFKNPYLGNTCVPFQHWACSQRCAMAIEIPAREEQITAARDLDKLYDAYIRECQKQYNVSFNSSPIVSIHRSNTRSGSHGSLQTSVNTTACSWRRRRRHVHCCVS